MLFAPPICRNQRLVNCEGVKKTVREYCEFGFSRSVQLGHKVAVIGAGPAGLACASELRKGGYEVTVFEKENTAGGLVRFGIPDYQMSKAILDDEVKALTDAGVSFKFGCELGRDVTVDGLKSAGYEAVFVAIGAGKKAPVVLADVNGFVIKSCDNIAGVKTTVYNSINVYDILNCDKLVLAKDAAEKIQEAYVKGETCLM